MSSKQALIQEIDTLPQDSIDEVSTFVSFLKFRTKQVKSKPDTWNELFKLTSEMTEDEKPRLEDFPRLDFGRPLSILTRCDEYEICAGY